MMRCQDIYTYIHPDIEHNTKDALLVCKSYPYKPLCSYLIWCNVNTKHHAH